MNSLPSEAIFGEISMSAFEGTPLDMALPNRGIHAGLGPSWPFPRPGPAHTVVVSSFRVRADQSAHDFTGGRELSF